MIVGRFLRFDRQFTDGVAGPYGPCVRGILRICPPRDRPCHRAERCVHPLPIRGCQDELAREALPDLDHAGEDVRVAVAFLKRRDCHDLWYCAKPVDFCASEPGQVAEAVRRELERVGNQLIKAPERRVSDGGGVLVFEVTQVTRFGIFFPDRLRPERASVHVVLEVVPYDVRLLQEQAHAVAQEKLPGKRGLLESGGREEAGQTLAH
mmetsp:Transcript_6541/g.13702  ORF Transcript_6541/g.13702 Transcript_6541/m.13702 type:complete len:208 (+) Transcript_6541:488-1111(+)